MEELLSLLGLGSLAGKPLTITQKCLAHIQASRVISDIEYRFLYQMPYHSFSSTSLLSVGDKVARDYRPWEVSGLMTTFPLQLREAKEGETIIGTVLTIWEGKNPTGPEYGGSYLEEGAHETLGIFLKEGKEGKEDEEDEEDCGWTI